MRKNLQTCAKPVYPAWDELSKIFSRQYRCPTKGLVAALGLCYNDIGTLIATLVGVGARGRISLSEFEIEHSEMLRFAAQKLGLDALAGLQVE